MKFKKILVVGISEQSLDPKYWEMIDQLCDERVSLSVDSPDINKELKDTDCLLVYFNKADREMIDGAPNLKYIGALATGVGKIDSDYAKDKGIVVSNIPGYATESVAEVVFAFILEHIREISRAKKESKEGNRDESGFSATEIKDKTFGVLGLGSIGQRVAEIAANGFGAKVLYWSKNRKPDVESENIQYKELDELLPQCDFITLHLALNKETEGILNADRIAKIKEGAILVNTAPHELLNLDALEKRLKKGDITYIYDHTDMGDITDENLKRLQQYDNAISYPVLGYISKEARERKQTIFVANIENFLKGTPSNVVN